MNKESKERKRRGKGEQRAERGGVGEKTKSEKESEIYRKKQKWNELEWRPCFKRRSLFSVRDPSPEIELENRLQYQRTSKLRNM